MMSNDSIPSFFFFFFLGVNANYWQDKNNLDSLITFSQRKTKRQSYNSFINGGLEAIIIGL